MFATGQVISGAKVLATKHHVEIVDLVLRVRQRIVELEEANEKRAQLVSCLEVLSGTPVVLHH